MVFIDFIRTDRSEAVFDVDGTYVRFYSQAELLSLLENSPLGNVIIETCTLEQKGILADV